MTSETTLDLKAMEVHRNIAGRIYWKKRFADLRFHAYFNSRSSGSVAGGNAAYEDHMATTSAALLSRLNTIAGSERAKQVVLLSALGVFAYNFSMCTDVCIFTHLAPEGGDGGGMGNILPIRMRDFAGVGFKDFLTALRQNLRDDIKHGNYPIEKILDAHGLKLDEIPTTGLSMDGMHGNDLLDRCKPDILFSFSIDDGLVLRIRYNVNKFDAGCIKSLPEQYFDLLYKLISAPDVPVAPAVTTHRQATPDTNRPVKDRYVDHSKKHTHSSLRKAEAREYYHLSTVQKRLYYLTEFDKLSLSFNLLSVTELKGMVDKTKISRVIDKLIERHESLRTSIRLIENEPVQLVAERVPFEIEYLRSTEGEADLVIEKFTRPFDLASAPLFRVGLVEVNPESHLLLVDMHHIISDGTSFGVLIRDFRALYDDAILPPLELDYKDYAIWQQSKAYKRKTEDQKQFWVREFSEPFAPLDIPLDLSGPSTTEEDAVLFELSNEDSRRLMEIAQDQVATNSMFILSILSVLLSKISGQDDIVLGMAVAGREQLELENMVGMFPLVLPLRSYPEAGLTFREFLGSLKSTFLETLDNQSYLYEDLAKELNLERSTSRNPWFDVICFYQNFDMPELSIPDMQLSCYKGQNMVAGEKIILFVREVEERFTVKLIYSTALFKRETIERLAGYFKKIAEAVIGSVSVKIGEIEILGDKEKASLLKSFSRRPEIDRSKSFSCLFREQAEKTPSMIAVEHNGTMLTYEALYKGSMGLAARFMNEGLPSGSPIALFMPRGIEMLKGILAAFHYGCAYVPIDVDFPGQRVREILAESGSSIVLTTREMLPLVDELKLSIPALQKIILADQPDEIEPATNFEVHTSTDDLAYIIYTSGTSGKPKGAMIHQLGMINHLYAFIDVMGLNEEDVIAQTASPCFDISVWQFLAALMTGGRTYIVDKEKIREPALLIRAIQEGNVTIFQSVPSLLMGFLTNLPTQQDNTLSKLRWMITTGESLTVPLVKNWYSLYPDIPLLNAYGPTEASDDVTTYVVPYPPEGQLSIPIGRSIPNTRVYILNESLKLCPIGVKGEICIAGIGVGKGYWRDENKTNVVFVPNPLVNGEADPDYATLYKTGDFGYYLEDGNIICLGRKDDQVKIRGFRIELDEIAGWLLKYASIREAVILVKHHGGDKNLVAYYVADTEIPMTDLERYLSDHLPYYMIPSYFIHLRQLPLTLNAKLDKRLLPDIDITAKDDYSCPSNPTEEKLVELWAKTLRSDTAKISVHTNFFSLGGHSLNTITLINEVDKEFGVKIALKDFFQRPTIAGMANFILKSSL
jgi:amino acid adenylation domain-containing protein